MNGGQGWGGGERSQGRRRNEALLSRGHGESPGSHGEPAIYLVKNEGSDGATGTCDGAACDISIRKKRNRQSATPKEFHCDNGGAVSQCQRFPGTRFASPKNTKPIAAGWLEHVDRCFPEHVERFLAYADWIPHDGGRDSTLWWKQFMAWLRQCLGTMLCLIGLEGGKGDSTVVRPPPEVREKRTVKLPEMVSKGSTRIKSRTAGKWALGAILETLETEHVALETENGQRKI